jgi:thiosulfate dehydrogenase
VGGPHQLPCLAQEERQGEHHGRAGAGLLEVAAAYIKANMPLGNYLELTDQQAWDAAAFINSHERPQDPRFAGYLAETTEQFHGSEFDYHQTRGHTRQGVTDKGSQTRGQLNGDPDANDPAAIIHGLQ